MWCRPETLCRFSADIMNGADVGMDQRRSGLRFALKIAPVLARAFATSSGKNFNATLRRWWVPSAL